MAKKKVKIRRAYAGKRHRLHRLGTPKVNPKHKVLERMIRRSIALSRRYDEISVRYPRNSTKKADIPAVRD